MARRNTYLGRTGLVVGLMLVAGPALSEDGTEREARGALLVVDKCGACHAVGFEGDSPHRDAPAFRTLSRNYPVGDLRESLAEGIMTGHPDMPVFEFGVEDIERIIAWLERIQDK